MDVGSALGAVTQAITIVNSLKDLERSLDAATYKARIAELYSSLADVKMALTDARQELHDKDNSIRGLQVEIAALK
jgi:hypothetical protein